MPCDGEGCALTDGKADDLVVIRSLGFLDGLHEGPGIGVSLGGGLVSVGSRCSGLV